MKLLIWKSLKHRKLQNLAIIFSIAIGVGIVHCVALIYQGVNSGIEYSKQRMGADIVVVPYGASLEPGLVLFGGAADNYYFKADTTELIRAIPGVLQVTPQFFTQGLSADCHEIGDQNRMIGYDPETDWIIKPWLNKIEKTELKDDEVILGAKVPVWAENKISILNKWYNIVTIAEETGTTLDYSILVNMEEARRVAGESASLQFIWKTQGSPDGLVSAVLVKIDPDTDLETVAKQIRKADVVQPIVASQVSRQIHDQFTALVWILGGIGILTITVALFQLFTRLYTLTWERQAEWGLYLAIGATGRKIMAIIVSEALAVALSGSLLGVSIGGILYQISLELLQSNQSFPFVHPSWAYVSMLSLGLTGLFVVFGILAAWLPAFKGSRTDPGIVMTRGEFD